MVELFHKPRQHKNILIKLMFLKHQSAYIIHVFALVITDIADPMRLLKDMRTEGLTLKQNVLGRVFDPGDPNQVRRLYQKPECEEEVYL